MNYNLKQQFKLIAPFIIVIFNLLIIVIAIVQLFAVPSLGIIVSPPAKVGFIDPFSEANTAVQVGDDILAINSHSIADEPLLAQQAMTDNNFIGATLQFDFARVDEMGEQVSTYTLPIVVTTPSPIMIVLRASPIIVALAFWLMGVLFVIYRPAGYIQRYLFVFCQAWAALLTVNATVNISWLQSVYFVISLTAVFITILLHLHFPVVVKPTTRRVIIFIVGSFIAVEGILEIYVLIQPNIELRAVLDTVRSLLLFLSLLFALSLVMRAYFVSQKADEKRQIGFVTIGGGIAILPLFVFSFLPNFFQGYPIFPYELMVYLFVAIPISYGYAIWKLNFVTLARYASRTSTIILSITIIFGLYIILSYTLLNRIPLQNNSQSLLGITIIILPILLFMPYYNRLQRWLDGLFFGGWYSYSLVVDQVSATLGKVDDSSNLPQILSDTVKQLMRLKWIGLYLPDEQGILHLAAFAGESSVQSAIRDINLTQHTKLVKHLTGSAKVQTAQEIYAILQHSDLTPDELSLLNRETVHLLVPIIDLTNAIGLFAVGAKETGDPFDLDDIKILDVISRLTSTTFQNFQLIRKLEEKAAENEQYKREILRVREEERKHISRELHDQVIQELVGLNYQIAGLRREIPEPSTEAETAIDGLQEVISSLIQTTRLLCQDLRPPALDLGLIPSVRSIVHKFQTRSETAVELIIDGDRYISIDETVALCLYRCINEALENAFRHAQATQIIVKINVTEKQIFFAVSDNGCGFIKPENLGEFMKHNHYGLVGMRERVELFEGIYNIETQPQHGTIIKASIPIGNHLNSKLETQA